MKRRRKRRLPRRQPVHRYIYDPLVIVGSVLGCTLLSLTRLPGMELSGFGPNWFVIWLVVWSIDRSALQIVLASLCLGWIQDSLSAVWPTHILGMAIVGLGLAYTFGHRFWKSDLFMVPVLVFIAVVMNDGFLSILFSLQADQSLWQTWHQQPDVFWISPLLSAIWAPALYWPLTRWWTYLNKLQG